MPDLIYNVKFEIDQASAQKVGNIVDTSNAQDIKVLQKEIERLNNVLKESTIENGKVNKSVKEKILAYKQEVSSLKLLETEINKSIQVHGKFSKETKSLIFDLQRQANAVDVNGQELLELANASDRTTGEVIALTNAVSTGNRAMVAGAKRAREMARAQQMVAQQVGQGNKTFAAGNQAIFSFSDLIQDSAQFSFGFAQGMRAIGNNIGFTAELLAVMSAQAKAAGVSLRTSLLSSLKGVNGVVLGINVAVTAFTMVSQALTKQSKELNDELEKQKELLEEVADSFSDAFGINSIKLLERVGNIIDGYSGLYEEQITLQRDIDFLTSSTSDGLSRGVQLVRDENELLINKRDRLSQIEGLITSLESKNAVIAGLAEDERDKVLEIVKARKEELELRRNMRLLFLSALTEEEIAQQVVDAKNQVFTDMEKKYKDVRNKIIEDPIPSDLLELDEPLFPDDEVPVGSIASLQQLLKELTSEYETETDKSERAILDSRIQGIQTRINFLKDGLAGVLSFEELGIGEFDKTVLRMVDGVLTEVKLPIELDIIGEDELIKSQVQDQQDAINQIMERGHEQRVKLQNDEVESKKALLKQDQNNNKASMKAIAQTAASIIPSLFEDQKASAIASALVNAGSAIVRQYADLPLAAAIPASIATAAATQKQIQQIKNTNFGDTGGTVSGGEGGGTSGISPISSSDVSQPMQSISFLPNAATSGQAPPTIDVKIDRAGLAVAVGKGGREIGNKQVRV